MAHAHSPKPSLRSPAMAEERYPSPAFVLAWLPKNPHPLLKLFVPVLFALAACAGPNDKFPQSTFFQFLTDPNPGIAKATFRKEVFLAQVPAEARKQTFTLRMRGGDYLLAVVDEANPDDLALTAGLHKGVSWGAIGAQLTLSDQAINKSLTPIKAQELSTRITADLFLNLGIMEMVKGSARWDEANQVLVSRSTQGGDLLITFDIEGELPKRANLKNGAGQQLAYVDYDYSPSFCEGKLPSRFSRHTGSPGKDLGLSCVIESIALQYSTNSGDELNPLALLQSKAVSFYSNDILYRIDPEGKAQRVLTAEEHQASLKPPKFGFIRLVTLGALALGVVAITFFMLQKKHNA